MYGYGNSMFLATHGILARGNAGTPPVNTVAPVISGGTSLGSVLSSTTGTWTGTPTITYAYQWKRNGIDIGGATSSTYTIVVADSAANITCQVTATNAFGTASAISNTITAQTFTAPVNTVAPAITGTAQEGQTLTCSTGTWTGNPTPTYAYQWKRNNVNIGSATNSTYLLVSADVGQSIKCTVTATNAIGSVNADSNSVTPTAALDPDAQAFITSASITNPTQQSAINQLVVDLKGYGVWTKMKALYPFVGGTAAQHKWNLKDPRDLDVAFRLQFFGGWTHSVNGALPNGTNAVANTFYNLSIQSTTANISAGFYSRTNTTSSGTQFGCVDGSYNGLALSIKYSDNNTYYSANDYVVSGSGNFVSDTRGFFIINKISTSAKRIYRNGIQISTSTPTGNTAPNDVVNLGARRYGGYTSDSYDTRQHSFTFLGDTLTNTEAANFYTAVQAFQTTLGRQV